MKLQIDCVQRILACLQLPVIKGGLIPSYTTHEQACQSVMTAAHECSAVRRSRNILKLQASDHSPHPLHSPFKHCMHTSMPRSNVAQRYSCICGGFVHIAVGLPNKAPNQLPIYAAWTQSAAKFCSALLPGMSPRRSDPAQRVLESRAQHSGPTGLMLVPPRASSSPGPGGL